MKVFYYHIWQLNEDGNREAIILDPEHATPLRFTTAEDQNDAYFNIAQDNPNVNRGQIEILPFG